jgi:hypothetical protein
MSKLLSNTCKDSYKIRKTRERKRARKRGSRGILRR